MTTRDIRSTVATSQATVNYDLPLWSGEDVTTWQGNLNDAMNKIDSAMFENKTAMLGYKEIADELEVTNGSTVELVNEVNTKLTEINQQYEQVKAELATANQNISEANQAILSLRTEDKTVKMQLDEMQDDIGKLMEWHVGKWARYDDINITDSSGTVHAKTHDAFLIGSSVYIRVVPTEEQLIYTTCYISEDDSAKILNLLGLNPSKITLIGTSSYLPRERASIDVWLDGTRLLVGLSHNSNIDQLFSCSAVYHLQEV